MFACNSSQTIELPRLVLNGRVIVYSSTDDTVTTRLAHGKVQIQMNVLTPGMSAVICPICKSRMTFRERILSFVCLNEKHGILQMAIGDQCYITGRKEVAKKLAKKHLKNHLIKDENLLTFGL